MLQFQICKGADHCIVVIPHHFASSDQVGPLVHSQARHLVAANAWLHIYSVVDMWGAMLLYQELEDTWRM